jgi:hypothetical protein
MNKLKVNVYDKLAINKEPYTLASQAALAQGALGIEAAREGEVRGAGASAGRIQMAQNQTQNEIRAAMGTDMYKLQLASAEEDARNRDLTAQLNLAQAEGAQAAAADAYTASQQSLTQGMKQLVGLGASAAAMAPDVIKNAAARNIKGLKSDYESAVKSGAIDNTFLNDKGEPLGFEMTTLKKMALSDEEINKLPIFQMGKDQVTGEEIKTLSPPLFDAWLQTLSKEDLKALGDTGYVSIGGLQAPPQERTPRFNNPFDITMGGFNYR